MGLEMCSFQEEIAKRVPVHIEIIVTMRFISYKWRLSVPLRMCVTNLSTEVEIKGLEASVFKKLASPNRV